MILLFHTLTNSRWLVQWSIRWQATRHQNRVRPTLANTSPMSHPQRIRRGAGLVDLCEEMCLMRWYKRNTGQYFINCNPIIRLQGTNEGYCHKTHVWTNAIRYTIQLILLSVNTTAPLSPNHYIFFSKTNNVLRGRTSNNFDTEKRNEHH